MWNYKMGLLCGLFFAQLGTASASDTLKINLAQADSIFLARNYQLLIAGLNIEARKAAIIQAKLYPNLTFTASTNAYDMENNRAFHVGATGQKFFQLEQLLILGGKRKANIDIAKNYVTIAEFEFEDVLKNLRFQLHSGFHILAQKKSVIDKYDEQIKLLSTIIDAYGKQELKGNVALKDVVRLKGVSLSLRAEKANLIQEYTDQLLQLQILLQTDLIIAPQAENPTAENLLKVFSQPDLLAMAAESRPDYKIKQAAEKIASLNIEREKREVAPNLTVFSNYDQRSGAFTSEFNLGVALELPLWNRNQGGIKLAKIQAEQAQIEKEQFETQVSAEVKIYLAKYNRAVRDFQVSNELFNDDFAFTANGMIESFKKGNVSLIEFVDFFESYNDAMRDFANIKVQLAISAEELNLKVGNDLFK